MITQYCGEDSVACRAAFVEAIEVYKLDNFEIIFLQPSGILEIQKGMADNLSLFSTQKVFCIENLEKYSFKKSTKTKKDTVYEALVSISENKSILVLDFEEGKQARLLKLKEIAKSIEFKPAKSIFQLLDECYPSNKEKFVNTLRIVCETQDEMFLFVMLFRHVRLLVLASQNILPIKTPPWQKFKILGQAKKWDKQKIQDYYSGLIKIEVSTKTSSNPYGIAKSLEILACHYM